MAFEVKFKASAGAFGELSTVEGIIFVTRKNLFPL